MCNALVLIAELGTYMSVFPTPVHSASWARLTSRTLHSSNNTALHQQTMAASGQQGVRLCCPLVSCGARDSRAVATCYRW